VEASQDGLDGHPDRERWNAKYAGRPVAAFRPHPLAIAALRLPLPDAPVADLACGLSGSALLAAAGGHRVTAVDVSDVALGLLGQEAQRRGLAGLITMVHADLAGWRPAPGSFALILGTRFWDPAVFAAAVTAVAPGGVLGWEAFTAAARHSRRRLPAAWCLDPGEPAALLPPGFEVLTLDHVLDEERGGRRRLLARRTLRARVREGPG
jgi:SAM-dependent methyltransferase